MQFYELYLDLVREQLLLNILFFGGGGGSGLVQNFLFSLIFLFVFVQDYELKFGLWAEHAEPIWHGGVATIEFHPGAEVWGVIWTLSNENLTSLDK